MQNEVSEKNEYGPYESPALAFSLLLDEILIALEACHFYAQEPSCSVWQRSRMSVGFTRDCGNTLSASVS
jgi:hypothetical protein